MSSPEYGALQWIVGDGSTGVTLAAGNSYTSTSAAIDLRIWSEVLIHPQCNFKAAPADNVDVSIIGSMDGTFDEGTNGYHSDIVPLTSIKLDKGTDPNSLTIILNDPPPYLKVKMQQDGGTDTTNVVMCCILPRRKKLG